MTSRSRSCQETNSSLCRTEEVAKLLEAGGVRSSSVHRSTTNRWVGIVSLEAVSNAKAVRRLGDSTSSHRTRTRSSCMWTDQVEPTTSHNRSCQETNSILCRTEEVAKLLEAGGVRSSSVRRSTTNRWVGIVSLEAVSKLKAVRQLGDSTSSHRTRTHSSGIEMDQVGMELELALELALEVLALVLEELELALEELELEMEAPMTFHSRSCQETNSSHCRTGEVANQLEGDGARSSFVHRSTTNRQGDIASRPVVWVVSAILRQEDSTSSHCTRIPTFCNRMGQG